MVASSQLPIVVLTNRQKIVELSAPVFNQFGYAGTRMDMIIKATGYQKGGIYKHFSSKLELTKAAFEFNYQKLKEGYLAKINENDTPKEKLIAFVNNYRFFIEHAPVKGGCPILNTAIETDDTIEELRNLAKQAIDEWITTIANIIEEGQKNKQFKISNSPVEVAQYIISTIEGAIMIGRLRKDKILMQKIADQLMIYLEATLLMTSNK